MGKFFEKMMLPMHRQVGINDALAGKPLSKIKQLAGGDHWKEYYEGYKHGLELRKVQALEKRND